jgi:hypothetical protein
LKLVKKVCKELHVVFGVAKVVFVFDVCERET